MYFAFVHEWIFQNLLVYQYSYWYLNFPFIQFGFIIDCNSKVDSKVYKVHQLVICVSVLQLPHFRWPPTQAESTHTSWAFLSLSLAHRQPTLTVMFFLPSPAHSLSRSLLFGVWLLTVAMASSALSTLKTFCLPQDSHKHVHKYMCLSVVCVCVCGVCAWLVNMYI